MIKVISKSVREYLLQTILTPILVTFEVVIECIIPFIISILVNRIKDGCDINMIVKYGLILITTGRKFFKAKILKLLRD